MAKIAMSISGSHCDVMKLEKKSSATASLPLRERYVAKYLSTHPPITQ